MIIINILPLQIC